MPLAGGKGWRQELCPAAGGPGSPCAFCVGAVQCWAYKEGEGAVGTPRREGESTTNSCARGVKQCLLGWMPPEGSLPKAPCACACRAFAQYLCVFCNKKAVCSVHHTGTLSVPSWWLCLAARGKGLAEASLPSNHPTETGAGALPLALEEKQTKMFSLGEAEVL